MANAGSTWKVSGAVMASRVLGLAREMMFAALFAGVASRRWMDCFYLAFKVPNLLRDLFAEGALSQAFVTTFAKKSETDGQGAAWTLANKMLTLTAVFMGAVTVAGVLLAPWIVELLTLLARSGRAGRGYSAEEAAFTVTLVKVMYPFILLVSLAALVMGLLNARHVFGMPALSSCFFNLGSMIGGAALGWWLDPAWGPKSLLGFAGGVLIGGLAQLVCQFPALRRVGYRFAADFRWRDPGVRQVLRLMGPAVVSASVVQVNVMINAMFAYSVGEGAVSWLNWAFRLMQLPLGMFGVAVATVSLPSLSRAALGGSGGDFRATLAHGLRQVTFLVFPCLLGLVLLAEPVVSVLYEHGGFDPADRAATALALRSYAYGLLFYSALKVLQPAFYAIERRWWPMVVSLLSLAWNIGFNWLFVFVLRLGHDYLALTTSISASLNFAVLYLVMRRHTGGLEEEAAARLLGRLLLAGGAMAALCWAANRWLFADPGSLRLWARAAWLALTVGAAAGVYFGLAALLRVPEATEVFALLARRWRRR